MRSFQAFACFFIGCMLVQICKAQQQQFVVNGQIIGVDNGSVQLFPVGVNDRFRDLKVDSGIFSIRNGKFVLTGKMDYPHAFYIFIKNESVFLPSDIVFIAPGIQSLTVSADSIKNRTPVIHNSPSNSEFLNVFIKEGYGLLTKNYNDYLSDLQHLSRRYSGSIPDSIRLRMEADRDEIRQSKHRYLYKYATLKPDSYVSLWIAVDLFSSGGYSLELEKTFESMAPKIKRTKTGKYLHFALMKSKKVSPGQLFPIRNLADTAGKFQKVSFVNNKYTLIDFWYSNCAPCIKQFPELLSLNESYKSKGFGIVQISIDAEARRGSMINLINQYRLYWPHYWDKNGVKTSGYFINQFPTNILVDSRGIIVAKNLGIASLGKYLENILDSQ